MRVYCHIEEDEVESDSGYMLEGIVAICSKCGHRTEACGIEENSILRCLALMRENCPTQEGNFYARKDED